MQTIEVRGVQFKDTQRRIRPWKVRYIASKMEREGYNKSYPITLEQDGRTLVDGGHRVEAAKIVGIDTIPFIVTTEDPIKHAIRCNADGADTEEHDVFDLAELCYALSKDGIPGAEIAPRLGWESPSMVTFHKQIKDRLHARVFRMASGEFTKKPGLVNDDKGALVNQEFTIVNFKETHLRALISELPAQDNASYRGQLRVIRQALEAQDITAKKIGQWASREAWYRELGILMRDTLSRKVGLRSWIDLYSEVKDGVYGQKRTDQGLEKFEEAVSTLNKKALGVQLYCDDARQRLPMLEDDSISLVIIDPPYNVTEYDWDQMGTPQEYLDWLFDILEAAKPKLKDDYHLFMFCDPDYAADIEIGLKDDGWPLKSRVIWEYRNLVKGRDVTDKFIVNYQICFHCGTHKLNWSTNWNDKRFAVQNHAAPQSNFQEGKAHPHQKPLDLIKLFVEVGSKVGDTVLDFFAGSGTTGQATSDIGSRTCILIEKIDNYCSEIESRLEIKRNE